MKTTDWPISVSTMEGSTGALPAIRAMSTICLGKGRFGKSGKTLGNIGVGGGEGRGLAGVRGKARRSQTRLFLNFGSCLYNKNKRQGKEGDGGNLIYFESYTVSCA